MGSTKVKEEKAEESQKAEKPKAVDKSKAAAEREIVRLANTDIDTNKYLFMALAQIKGISYSMSKSICSVAGFDPRVRLNALSEQDREKLENIIYNPSKFGLPSWLLNRRNDVETGQDLHLIGSDLEVANRFDVQKMIDLKTWKGVRHMYGMPTRGQRNRSTHHKGKTVGVVRKAVRLAMAKAGEGEKKDEKK